MTRAAVLRTENLRKAYGDKVVLRDIDLSSSRTTWSA